MLPTFQVRASAVCAEPLCRARIVSPTQQGRLTGWGSAVGSLGTVGRRSEQRLAFRKLRGRVRPSRMLFKKHATPQAAEDSVTPLRAWALLSVLTMGCVSSVSPRMLRGPCSQNRLLGSTRCCRLGVLKSPGFLITLAGSVALRLIVTPNPTLTPVSTFLKSKN